MNSPYMGKFRVSQEFKGAAVHDGLDLVGIDSKEVHCVVSGTVIFCGWENSGNHKQGFGRYVKVQAANGDIWYYGHLSDIRVKAGQDVRVTDVLGTEGSTGHSTGSHLHICCRPNGIKAKAKDVSELLKIPNAKGTYDDGYLAKMTGATTGNEAEFLVKITCDKLNVRADAGINNKGVGTVSKDEVFTIIETKKIGSVEWGRLKSGTGWISLKAPYSKRI